MPETDADKSKGYRISRGNAKSKETERLKEGGGGIRTRIIYEARCTRKEFRINKFVSF